jgi:predicted permease
MSWWSRVSNVLRSDRLDRELDEEQRFHIEARAEELESKGLSRQAALEQARRQFGPPLRLRESSREVKLLPWVESLIRDLTFGLRLLKKDAMVSLAAVVSLGLAIGACTAAFSLIDALILRQLPVREPNRLVYVNRAGNGQDSLFSYPFLERVRQTLAPHMEVFSMGHQSLRQAVLPDANGVEEKLLTQFVSGNAFNALGITAAIGRTLQPSDDLTPGAHSVAVVSHAFWTRRLARNPNTLGLWIQVEQRSYQIVGIAPDGFTGAQPGQLTDIWLSNMMFTAHALNNPNSNWLQIWGRLAPGETRKTVLPIVLTTFTNFEGEPSANKEPSRRDTELPIDLRDASAGFSRVRHDFERPLFALAAIVGLVLLIACSNVANLLLARSAARRREMALRASIGASRWRLVQQVLVESSVLTGAAAGVGVLGAIAAVPLIVGMLTTNENPVYLDARLDWRVLTFVAVLGCATTVLFGVVPALRASTAAPGEAIAHGGRYAASAGMARSLLAVQIGFSLMILFVAGLLLRSFDRLLAVDLGFRPEHVTLLSVEARDRLEPAQAREVGRQLLARVQELPGVESASVSGWALFRGWSNGNNVGLPDGGRAQTFRLAVSPQFFRTLRTPLLDGREFVPADSDATDPIPIIVNEAFARKYLPGERAVGLRLSTTRGGRPISYEIVGLVASARDGSVRGEMSAFLFSPIQDADGTIEIRSAFDPRTVADRVREVLPQIHPSLRLVDVTLQTSLVWNTLLRERLLAVLSAFFAALGLVLAAIGLYGVSSYAVVRRTREIGIRLALGAQAPAVVRSVAGGIALAVAAGTAAGLAGGLYFARFMQTFLFETDPVSPSSLALPLLWLFAVALAATWRPLRRATHVDPVEALRAD